jgi:hypothetical protein
MAVQFGMATMVLGGVEIGCLQNVSIDFNFESAELFCGSALYPRDVRVHTARITGNAEFAELTAVGIEKLLGGTLTGSQLQLDNTDAPSKFQMVTSLVTDGITFSITFKKVLSNKLSLAFARDGHLIPNFDFMVQADTDGSVATIEIGDIS